MAKVSSKEMDRALSEMRAITGIPAVIRDVSKDYGLMIIGSPVSQGLIRAHDLSPRFSTRDELLVWMQGFVSGWQYGRE